MIQKLKNLPVGTIGFRASGTVSAEDYTDVLKPAVAEAIEHRGKVNLVYVLGGDLDRFTLGAMFQDGTVGTRAPREWGRIAVVSDHEWINGIVHFVMMLYPAQVRIFALAKQDDAIAWASEGSAAV